MKPTPCLWCGHILLKIGTVAIHKKEQGGYYYNVGAYQCPRCGRLKLHDDKFQSLASKVKEE